jgi:hypothetical protein
VRQADHHFEKPAERKTAIQREKDDGEYRAKRISLSMGMLAGQEECLQPCSQSFREKTREKYTIYSQLTLANVLHL